MVNEVRAMEIEVGVGRDANDEVEYVYNIFFIHQNTRRSWKINRYFNKKFPPKFPSSSPPNLRRSQTLATAAVTASGTTSTSL
ncbi:hypothetical protein L6452_17554 [Arctium lappa]|uniref:Uncharacterized protein n=1 Tax=Arctium lappa TaxID=4217 RepID=A0ACB9C3P5_ARCLA|nr:hypothetical protein L6452_17554 [Arctium lappa]